MGTEIETTEKWVKMCSAGNRTRVSWLPADALPLGHWTNPAIQQEGPLLNGKLWGESFSSLSIFHSAPILKRCAWHVIITFGRKLHHYIFRFIPENLLFKSLACKRFLNTLLCCFTTTSGSEYGSESLKYYLLLYRQECFTGKYTARKIHTKLHPGPEWRIFHILTSEDIDDVISRSFTAVRYKQSVKNGEW